MHDEVDFVVHIRSDQVGIDHVDLLGLLDVQLSEATFQLGVGDEALLLLVL